MVWTWKTYREKDVPSPTFPQQGSSRKASTILHNITSGTDTIESIVEDGSVGVSVVPSLLSLAQVTFSFIINAPCLGDFLMDYFNTLTLQQYISN